MAKNELPAKFVFVWEALMADTAWNSAALREVKQTRSTSPDLIE
jgi:hypothetical protein